MGWKTQLWIWFFFFRLFSFVLVAADSTGFGISIVFELPSCLDVSLVFVSVVLVSHRAYQVCRLPAFVICPPAHPAIDVMVCVLGTKMADRLHFAVGRTRDANISC